MKLPGRLRLAAAKKRASGGGGGGPGGGAGGDPYWNNVTLLMKFDGDFVDAASGVTFTAVGGIAANGTPKFGSASLQMGNGKRLTAATNDAFKLGTGDFTIEGWIYHVANGAYQNYVDCRSSLAPLPWSYTVDPTNHMIADSTGGAHTSSGTLTANAWNHAALVRSGTTLTWYINGVASGSTTNSNSFDAGGTFSMGSRIDSQNANNAQGLLDSFRITKGVARYTANFTPPTEDFPEVWDETVDPYWPYVYSHLPFDGDLKDLNGLSWVNNGGIVANSDAGPFAGTNAAGFNGSNQYLTLANTGTRFAIGTSDFTIEVIVKVTATPSNNGVLLDLRLTDSVTNYVWFVRTSPAKYLSFLAASGFRESSSPFVQDVWAHAAVTRHAGVLRMFISGVQVYSASVSDNFTVAGTPKIGAGAGPAAYLPAKMSDFRFTLGYGRYVRNFDPPTIPLYVARDPHFSSVVALLFNNSGNADATTLIDQSSYAHTVSIVGAPGWKTAYPLYSLHTTVYFDTNACAYITDAGSNFVFGTGDFTIEGWYLAKTNLTAWQGLYDARTASSSVTPHIGLNNGIPYFIADGAIRITASVAPTDNVWHHIAVSRVDGVTRMYVDFTQVGSDYTDSNDYTSRSAPVLAAIFDNTLKFWGYMASWRITKGVGRYTGTTIPSIHPRLPVLGPA